VKFKRFLSLFSLSIGHLQGPIRIRIQSKRMANSHSGNPNDFSFGKYQRNPGTEILGDLPVNKKPTDFFNPIKA
jgi:hypothetical protein